jgi:hypothetical protein
MRGRKRPTSTPAKSLAGLNNSMKKPQQSELAQKSFENRAGRMVFFKPSLTRPRIPWGGRLEAC